MVEGSAAAGSASQEAVAAWRGVRDDSSIQFDQPPPPEPPDPPFETPEWLKATGESISDAFAGLGAALTGIWPVLQYVLLALLAVGVFALIVYIGSNIIADRRKLDDATVDTGWRPDAKAARALLEEADALAAKGEFAEAIRLILWRSIEDITKAEPRAIIPSNTAREISRFTILSDHARNVFTMIAGHVERGIFAGQSLGREAWEEARSAYDSFAIAGDAR
ncbi:MAG: hypothetical protein AAFX04_02905 [Pseudomonadota bacterium]